MKHRPIVRIALSLATAACVTSFGTSVAIAGSSPATAKHPSPDAAAVARSSPAASSLANLPDIIQGQGEARFPGIYGGLMVTDHQRHLDVFLTSLSPAAESALRQVAGDKTITFLKTPHTRLQLQAIHARVTARFGALDRQGIRLVTWFPGINGDGVEDIGVLNLTSRDVRTLNKIFGASNIALHNVTRSEAPRVTGRNSDSAPWNGGDNLTSHSIGCTSGVGIDDHGTDYMVTAAHCYEPGWTIFNALAGQPGTQMGTEHSRDVRNGGDDTALLSMSVSGLVWTGVIGNPVRATVTGDATNPDGDTVCNEGAYSGQVCSVVQNNSFGCVSVDGYTGLSGARTECNLVFASSSGIANQDGDSGGPMIRFESGNLKVTGIVSLGGGSEPACKFNKTTCFTQVYYTAMDEILSTEYPGSSLP